MQVQGNPSLGDHPQRHGKMVLQRDCVECGIHLHRNKYEQEFQKNELGGGFT